MKRKQRNIGNRTKKRSSSRRDLFHFDYTLDLPEQEVFPINETVQERTVKEILLKDIRDAEKYFIITGFTSLSYLIECFGSTSYEKLRNLRIVIGYDPDEGVSKRHTHYSLTAEIKNFWLKQNISIKLCGPIVNLIEQVRNGIIEFRAKDKLHAKIYISDDSVILGSSNFSKSGTMKQAEANIRLQSVKGAEKTTQLE